MCTTEESLNKALEAFFQGCPVPSEGPLVVGFSGGPDSTALALLLEGRFGSERIVLAYLNHGIRSPREEEEEGLFVRQFAREHKLKLVEDSLPRGSLARETRGGGSLEDIARRHRYGFFERVAEGNPEAPVFLGHPPGRSNGNLGDAVFPGIGAFGA